MLTSSQYKVMLWAFISAVDSGDFDDLSIKEVKEHAEAETTSRFLQQKFANYDFSMLTSDDWRALDEEWMSMHNAIDAQRKFGVQNKGMALLLAYTLQGLQSVQEMQKRQA